MQRPSLAHSAQLGISTRAALEKLFDSVAPENPETANQRLPAIKVVQWRCGNLTFAGSN
jgi:hypothetical protein